MELWIGAGLYAVGRPVQQKRTAKSAPITPCPSREGPYSTVFSVSRPMDPLMWLAGLLALSGDVETNPGPSTQTWTCVMFSTEHSINNKKTQQQINSKKTITIIQININGVTTKIHEPEPDRQYKNRHHNNPRNKTKTHSSNTLPQRLHGNTNRQNLQKRRWTYDIHKKRHNFH